MAGTATPESTTWWMLNRFARAPEPGGGGCRGVMPTRKRTTVRDMSGGWGVNHPAARPLRRTMYHVNGRKRATPIWA